MFILCRAYWLAVLLAVAAGISYAQKNPERASLTGVVHDQTGAALSGATVELSLNNVSRQSTTTDPSGSFRFNRIPPGKYQIQVTYQGFESVTMDVTVGLSSLAPLNISMAIASVQAETTITDEPTRVSTESSDNKDSVALSEQTLSNLPVFDQDYVGAM